MTDEQMRAEFEAWFAEEIRGGDIFGAYETGEYVSTTVSLAWWGWRAACALLAKRAVTGGDAKNAARYRLSDEYKSTIAQELWHVSKYSGFVEFEQAVYRHLDAAMEAKS